MAANLSHLKIGRVPAAFEEWAQKHNMLVALVESIEAAYGIDIKIIANPPKMLRVPGTPGANSKQPQGRIRVALKPGIIPGAGTGGGGGGTTQAVSIDGTLVNVATAFGVNTNTTNYPLALYVNNNGTALEMTPANGFKVYNPADAGGTMSQLDEFGLLLRGGGKSLFIDSPNLTHNMSVVTLQVCDNGNTKSIDVIASAPY